MKLTISNIAWRADEDREVAPLLASAGFRGLEIAPTRVWKDPTQVSDREIRDFIDQWKSYGLSISSFQSLLFGQPESQIFGDSQLRGRTQEYLEAMLELAARLGAKKLVFGSPKNRLRGSLGATEALDSAIAFFRPLGECAAKLDVQLCLEANPTVYGCDFITTTAEARELVSRVGSKGFGLHMDGAGATLAGDDLSEEIFKSGKDLCHFHVSQPNLKTLNDITNLENQVNYTPAFAALRKIDYKGWLSIEMRAGPPEKSNLDNISASLKVVLDTLKLANGHPQS